MRQPPRSVLIELDAGAPGPDRADDPPEPPHHVVDRAVEPAAVVDRLVAGARIGLDGLAPFAIEPAGLVDQRADVEPAVVVAREIEVDEPHAVARGGVAQHDVRGDAVIVAEGEVDARRIDGNAGQIAGLDHPGRAVRERC